MTSFGDALKTSFLTFPEFWLLLLVSFISGIKQVDTTKMNFSYLMGILVFYGLFGYLIVLFSLGLWSWDIITSEFKVTSTVFFVLRGFALWLGYAITKKYLYNHVEYGLKARKKNVAILIFAEFVGICGSIAGYLCLISALILFNSL